MNLLSPLVLPNGAVVPNRIVKAAMEENICDA
jgi:2,4-dienoyl-CoA reductase-like NADH-dependent reductase (Old Yellow Enzyme family)